MQEVGAALNEKKREAETLTETFERHGWIKGKEVSICLQNCCIYGVQMDITPDRRFLREDTFVDAKSNDERTVFITFIFLALSNRF